MEFGKQNPAPEVTRQLRFKKEHKKMKQELYRMYVELGKMALEIEDDNRFQKIMKQREELFKLIEML